MPPMTLSGWRGFPSAPGGSPSLLFKPWRCGLSLPIGPLVIWNRRSTALEKLSSRPTPTSLSAGAYTAPPMAAAMRSEASVVM